MRTFVLIIVMLVGTGLTMLASITSPYEHIEVEDISYDYHMEEKYDINNNVFLWITGTLFLTIHSPSDANYVFLEFRKTYLSDAILFDKAIYDVSEEGYSFDVEISDINWGTEFRARAIFADGHNECTQLYNTNTYIKNDDLDLILNQLDVDEPTCNDVSVTMRNNCIVVEPQSETVVDIVQPDGISIYSGILSDKAEIPIDSKFVIVRCKTKNKTTIRKFVNR